MTAPSKARDRQRIYARRYQQKQHELALQGIVPDDGPGIPPETDAQAEKWKGVDFSK